MKNATLAWVAALAIILSGVVLCLDMSGPVKVLVIWVILAFPGALLFARIFPRRGQ